MNRHEFLKQLEHALEAEMNPAKVREHVDYYRSYIAEEVKNGKSEKEVMDLLGDPWVIACLLYTSRYLLHLHLIEMR